MSAKCPRNFQDIPGTCTGNSRDLSRECSRNILDMTGKCLRNIPGHVHEHIQDFSERFPGDIQNIPDNFLNNARTFLGRVRETSGHFQDLFFLREVSMHVQTKSTFFFTGIFLDMSGTSRNVLGHFRDTFPGHGKETSGSCPVISEKHPGRVQEFSGTCSGNFTNSVDPFL